VDGVERTAQAAAQQADTAQKLAEGKFVYASSGDVVSVSFKTNSWKLSPEAQTSLTSLAESLKSANRNVFVEIIGHGDARGSVNQNRILGEKRALEVRRFLFGQGVALNRMETASWGEERSAGKGLKDDRRVDITVVG
jgi:peptidoglycan-associated lipoprotein